LIFVLREVLKSGGDMKQKNSRNVVTLCVFVTAFVVSLCLRYTQ